MMGVFPTRERGGERSYLHKIEAGEFRAAGREAVLEVRPNAITGK